MGFFHHIGHHVKRGALSVHGFFMGLLEGANIGNAVGSLAGAGIGALLAVTGVISGGLIPALIAGVAFGAMVGALAGGAIGSLFGATHDHCKTKEPPLDIASREPLGNARAQEPEQTPAKTQDNAASVDFRNTVDPAHYRTEEEGVSFRNRIAQERLAKAVADHANGAAGASR